MSWKNVKTHYKIEHIVQMREGKILIGSSYVSDLIIIYPNGKVEWGPLGSCDNDDLARYYKEMTADREKLVELIQAPDTFNVSLPVYTYERANIIEKRCEEYGWPNPTHDGLIQYQNEFTRDPKQAVRWAIDNAKRGVERMADSVKEAEESLALKKREHLRRQAILEELLLNYPTLK